MINISRTLTFGHTLPCGCHLSMCISCEDPSEDPQWVVKEAGKLAWWLTTRIPMHKCELVSEENTNGIAPRSE